MYTYQVGRRHPGECYRFTPLPTNITAAMRYHMRTRFYIYITTCLINNKKYIGQHVTRKKTINKMLKDRYYGSGTSLINSINKYGRKNFTKKIIKIFDSQEEADLFEIDYIENNNVLNNPTEWYNLSCGGQYTRGNYHGEQISKIMKVVCNTPEYRKAKGWLSFEDQEAKKLRGMRIYLINKMQMVRKIKDKEEKQTIAEANGFKTYAGYCTTKNIRSEESIAKVKQYNEYQKTPEGRESMSRIKAGVKHSGMGKYTNGQFDSLLTMLGLNNYEAAEKLNCCYDTVRLMRRGWIQRQGGRYPVYVKDIYYEAL